MRLHNRKNSSIEHHCNKIQFNKVSNVLHTDWKYDHCFLYHFLFLVSWIYEKKNLQVDHINLKYYQIYYYQFIYYGFYAWFKTTTGSINWMQ